MSSHLLGWGLEQQLCAAGLAGLPVGPRAADLAIGFLVGGWGCSPGRNHSEDSVLCVRLL